MKSFFTTFALLIGLAQPAFATGGFFCQTQSGDKNIDLEVSGGLSHGIPGMPFQVGGSLTVKAKGLESHSIANINDVAQFWQEGGQLNVMVYNESEVDGKFSSTTLVIKTNYSDITEKYVGTYTLYAFGPDESGKSKIVKGKVSCELE